MSPPESVAISRLSGAIAIAQLVERDRQQHPCQPYFVSAAPYTVAYMLKFAKDASATMKPSQCGILCANAYDLD
jgi:hypothetical protein